MLFSVKDLLSEGQKPITVQLNDSVAHAMELMAEHDFSQLPVVDADGKSLAQAITAESILEAICCFRTSPDSLRVKDATVAVEKFRSDADLLDALDDVQTETFVVVVDAEDRLTGIVTTADTTAHFRRYAEDLMIVQFVETTMKEAAQTLYKDDAPGLHDAIQRVTDRSADIKKRLPNAIATYLTTVGHLNPKPEAAACEEAFAKLNLPKAGKPFEKLTFEELKELLLIHESGPKLDRAKDTSELRTLLTGVRDIRNKLAHFQGDLTPAERKLLRFASGWLERNLPSSGPEPKTVSLGLSRHEPVETSVVAPVEEATSAEDSTYAPLAAYLNGQPGGSDEIRITFEQVEATIGNKLPRSAYEFRAWWANDPEKPHAAQWLDAGWRAQYINMSERSLTFVRIADKEDAYIRFYSEVKKRLGKVEGFPLSSLSPQGQSWHILAELPWVRNGSANLNASFTRKKELRVEVYLDCGDGSINKDKFDELFERKDKIELGIGAPLAWERMDKKRASRIAIYRDAHVMQDDKAMKSAVEWIVQQADRFYRTFLPHFRTA
jgi:CBS domain-containing protein